MSLYLKYRPQDFAAVVGQQHVLSVLQNALQRGALTHAYLFSGPRGTGKTSLARIIAKAINCLEIKDGTDPCNQCTICLDINKGRLVDLIEVDAASNRGIDEIRDLREKIQFSPTHARAKVYIIDEVHMLTKEAFNALLKTLEEPPDHAYFILATTEVHKIPETIISRCQQFALKRITAKDIEKRLADIAKSESVQAEAEALALIAKVANGGLRDAIGLFEQMILDGRVDYSRVSTHLGLSGSTLIESFFNALIQKNASKALEMIVQANSQGKNLHQFAGELIAFLREQMLINIGNPAEVAVITRLLDIFLQAKPLINESMIPQLPLEMAIVKACILVDEVKMVAVEAPVKEVASAKVGSTFSERESAKQESEAVTEVVSAEAGDDAPVDLEAIRKNWKKIGDKIQTPFIRLSFLDSEPQSFEKGELALGFKSASFMEKIVNQANQAEVQAAFESVFNRKFKLRMEVKKVDLKPLTPAFKPGKASVTEMAKEVFGE